MVDPILFWTFVPAALALNLSPGPDMMFCLAQGMTGGLRPALAASAGISTGTMVHVMLAGVGLGVLVESVPWLFGAIRWVGAGYLLWLAWRTLGSRLERHGAAVSPRRAFRDGLVVNLSNPKVILFVLALVPQFIDPALPVLPQFLALGAVLAVGGFFINGAVGAMAGRIGGLLAARPGVERGLRYGSAAIFAGLAARLGWGALRS